MEKLYYGLDLGIGSIGWAIIEENDNKRKRILNYGSHIFSSGEVISNNSKKRKSQIRREARSSRRLLRRRRHRRERLKNLLETYCITTREKMQQWHNENNPSIFDLRAKALDEAISCEELAACLINISNHRGYRSFYSAETKSKDLKFEDETENDYEDKKDDDTKKLEATAAGTSKLFIESEYRTIGEWVSKDERFINKNATGNKYPYARNRHNQYNYIFIRADLRDETEKILEKQKEYNEKIDDNFTIETLKIIFSQRDFETGPGDSKNKNRKYKGFTDDIEQCPYYTDEKKYSRGTAVGDIFAVINALSQYKYVDKETGELLACSGYEREIIDYFVQNASLKKSELIKILKQNEIEAVIPKEAQEINKCNKYLGTMKKLYEASGLDWDSLIKVDYLSKDADINRLGEILSYNITPYRRITSLLKSGLELNEKFIEGSIGKSFGGTCNFGFRYMLEAISAFFEGVPYGEFQWEKISEKRQKESATNKHVKLPVLKDENMIKNPVVYRGINETRKILNALISKYGSPARINVEIGRDISRSFKQRRKLDKENKEYEKRRENIKTKLKELEVSNSRINQQKYQLYEDQNHNCLYSGDPLDLNEIFSPDFQLDHIIPRSLILDDTINNKALVKSRENQLKKNMVPLQYMDAAKRSKFLEGINKLRKEGKISEKKYRYLTIKDTNSPECVEMLQDWKSRNLHDMRYISRYITNYLQDNLVFDSEKTKNVYAVKGSLTSRFRRLWLNGLEWGADEKPRETSDFHHAIDALVVANLQPAYIEIGSDYLRLREIKKIEGADSEEYKRCMFGSIDKMERIYGWGEVYTRSLLTNGRVPSFIPDLFEEIKIRFDSESDEDLKEKAAGFYKDDEFVKSLYMPYTHCKSERKFKGNVRGSENPVALHFEGDNIYQIKRKSIEILEAKNLPDVLFGADAELKSQLEKVFTDGAYKNVKEYMDKHGLDSFILPSGRTVKKISVKSGNPVKYYKDEYTEGLQQMWDMGSYYCVEIYKDKKGKTMTRAIRYIDLVKKHKKLCLTCPYPEDYDAHVMYLYKNDYIVVSNSNGEKFRGYYQSVKSINAGLFWIRINNSPKKLSKSIAQRDIVEKYEVDIYGRMGGKVKCGEPYSFLQDKN